VFLVSLLMCTYFVLHHNGFFSVASSYLFIEVPVAWIAIGICPQHFMSHAATIFVFSFDLLKYPTDRILAMLLLYSGKKCRRR
jgi:hypothetical protein